MGEALFQQWLDGDEQSFHLIYRIYYAQLRRFAAALVGSPEEGEDLAQEVFLRLHGARPKLEQEVIANGRALLYTIARRLAYQYSAYRARRERLTADAEAVQQVLLQTDEPMPDDLAAAAELRAFLRQRVGVAAGGGSVVNLQTAPNYTGCHFEGGVPKQKGEADHEDVPASGSAGEETAAR